MRRSRFRPQPQQGKPSLRKVSIHSLPDAVSLMLHFADGASMTFTFPPDQALSLSKGLAEAVLKAKEPTQ